ncbi:TBC1 domain family member 31-like [Hydra vulgaris]|uniref:TBC1 domain family member 31 n=1 Tax=Hydra vulgaris TaxID=6087 RepID=A0ABM4DNM2_HYDVU
MSNFYYVLDVGGRDQGELWSRKPVPNKGSGSFLLVNQIIKSKGLLSKENHVRFLHTSFDVTGERIATADHLGNVYVFNFDKNWFTLVCKTGIPLTNIVWNASRVNEVLIGLSNYELRCYNVVTKALVNIMKGHTSTIHSISIHGCGTYALSSSFDTTILWDLNTYTKCRTLVGAQEVGVQQVFFLSNSNKIVTCFKDDTLFIWDSETMKCLHQLHSSIGAKPGFKCLSVTNDTRILVAGGRSRFIYIWNLDSYQLIQIIELPEKITEVQHLEFVYNNLSVNQMQLLAILSQDGILRFIDTHLCKLEADIGSAEEKIHGFTLSKNGRYVAAILENGSILFYNMSITLNHLHKDTQPIIRKVQLNKGNNTSQEISASSSHSNTHVFKATEDSLYRELPKGLDMKKLRKILKGFGEYPAKYRLFIWKTILRLPENHIAFDMLANKGIHSSFVNIGENFPIKSQKLLRVLQKVLSALTYWSPIFGETEYLPMMVFPIIKLFPNNQLVCFEVAATILLTWCQKWFEFFPNPPLTILNIIEKMLGYHDPPLLNHFIKLDVSTQLYAWPMLYTLFSEIMTKDEWLVVWDNLFSNHPAFMLYFAVAYLIQSRQSLFSTKLKEDVEFYFHHHNAVDITLVIKETYRLSTSTPAYLDPKSMLHDFTPLTNGQYPIFDCYPAFVVDYLVEERERIREEELEYLRQKQLTFEFKKQKELTNKEEVAFYREQDQLLKAEQQRRELIIKEENKLAEKRKKLFAVRRELALRELESHDIVRRKFLQYQRSLKNIEVQRLDDELKRKIIQGQQEYDAVLETVEIKGLEIEAQKRKFQQELIRDEVNSSFQARNKQSIIRQHNGNEENKFRHLVEQALEIDGETIKELQRELAAIQLKSQNMQVVKAAELRNSIVNKRFDLRSKKLEELDFQNQLKLLEMESAIKNQIRKEEDALLEKDVLLNDNTTTQVPIDLFKSSESRGPFGSQQMDFLSNIKDLRLKMAHRKTGS